MLSVYSRVLKGRASLDDVIKAKCYYCANLHDVLNVYECRVFTCPLHAYRPQPKGGK